LDSAMASLFLRRFSNSAAQSSLWTQLGSAAHCSSEDESALSITFLVCVRPAFRNIVFGTNGFHRHASFSRQYIIAGLQF
jgi:hypothetical protein